MKCNISANGLFRPLRSGLSLRQKAGYQMKTRTTQKFENWSGILKRYSADILFFGISIFLPLFLENGYLNLTQAKAHAVYIIVFLSVIVFAIATTCARRERHNAKNPAKMKGLDDILIAFAVTLALSALCSQKPLESFSGSAGWNVGAFTMLCLVVAYFIISRYYTARVNAWFFVLIANSIIFLLTIVNSAGIDVSGAHANIVPEQFYLYVSTLGNVNWLSGYLCLILPAFLIFYMLSTQRATTLLYGAVLILGIMNILLCGSESIFAGIWVCTFFVLPFLLKESRRLQKLGTMLIAFGLSALFIRYVPVFAEKRNTEHGLFSIILDWKTALIICLLGFLCCFILPMLWEKLSEQTIQKITIILEILMFISLLILAYVFLKSYSESWGNYRGRIWNTSMEIFQNLGVREKLIGVGPELLGYYYDGLASHSQIVLTAHNELLQWLLTTGVLGAALWAALFPWLMISYFRSRCWEHKSIAYFLPLAAYFGQAMINSPNAMNIALFYLFLALYRKEAYA